MTSPDDRERMRAWPIQMENSGSKSGVANASMIIELSNKRLGNERVKGLRMGMIERECSRGLSRWEIRECKGDVSSYPL